VFDLFFSIDKFDVDNDYGDQFRAFEPTPMLLGFMASLKTTVGVAIREPEPLVRWVRSPTVAKLDSIGFAGP